MTQKSNPEEIDILQFFEAIGRMFKGLYNSISNTFKRLFYFFLEVLLYFKKHYIYLGLGVLLGFGLSFLGKPSDKSYYGETNLRTNFHAQLALQEKIDVLNNLIQKKDTLSLANKLNISPEKAGNFTSFELEPVFNDVLLIDDYEEYLMLKDTVVYKFIEFKDYKKTLKDNTNLNQYWKLKVYANNPAMFNNLNYKIISMLNKDKNIEKRKENYLAALKLKKDKIIKSLEDIDTMRQVFNKVLLKMAQNKSNAATNIVVSSDKIRGPEISYNLFEERQKLLDELKKVSLKINKYDQAVVMLNSLPEYGIKENKLLGNRHFKYAFYGFLFALFILLIKDFNAYLNKYARKKSLNKS